MNKLIIVYGAPCSGKSTYCKNNMKANDVVYDYDMLFKALTYSNKQSVRENFKSIVLEFRETFLNVVKNNENINNAYLITTWLPDSLKEKIKNEFNDDVVIYKEIEATKEECLQNLENDDERTEKEKTKQIIEKYFDKKGERMPISKDRQYRSMENLNVAQTNKRIDTDYYVEGYATTFQPYVLFEDSDGNKIYESFTRECFNNTDMSDIILQFDHSGKVFARQSNNTLIVEADDHGLFIAADLSKSEAARQLYEEIQSGLITKMSWGFMPNKFEFNKKTKTIEHKSVKKIYDVSAVSLPANSDTNINARSFVNGEIAKALKESQECEKLKLKIKLELLK